MNETEWASVEDSDGELRAASRQRQAARAQLSALNQQARGGEQQLADLAALQIARCRRWLAQPELAASGRSAEPRRPRRPDPT